jgi:asparagine synthase (glutamine-hydrolysing)
LSGVFGIFRFDGLDADARDLERQMRTLAHLGRDRARYLCDGAAGIGAILARVTQEDFHDAQPLCDDGSGLILVCDARIDNREEIAAALQIGDETLQTMADCALLLAAFNRWGGDCAERLIGDFVFAVWSRRTKTLTLARDHMGQRHIYYHAGENFFAFASEIKALWTLPEVPRELEPDFLAQRALRAPPREGGATPFEGVRGVPGGVAMTIDACGAIATRRYWEPQADPTHIGRDAAYYVATYRSLLEEAVACRLRRSIAPAGLFMSGGFDTAAISALAGPVLAAQGRNLIAASSVMPEEYTGTVRHARKWVEACRRHMPHLDVRYVTSETIDLLDGIERCFLRLDRMAAPSHAVSEALFKEIASRGGRVVMDGYGGDYTLNPRGTDALARMLIQGQFRRFRAEFAATRRRLRQSVKQTVVRNVLIPLVPPELQEVWTRYKNGMRLFGPRLPVIVPAQRPGRKRKQPSPPLRRLTEPLSERKLRILRAQQDAPAQGPAIAAAAHGLQFTRPFHDKRVVEFALAIPDELAYRNGRERFLALEALGDLYPPEIRERPPGNDDEVPDFLAMAKRAEPRILADVERMEKAGRLPQYFDFALIKKMLRRRRVDEHASGWEQDTLAAVRAYFMARYIEWFNRDNC